MDKINLYEVNRKTDQSELKRFPSDSESQTKKLKFLVIKQQYYENDTIHNSFCSSPILALEEYANKFI